MDLKTYQERAFNTALPSIRQSIDYMTHGLTSEAGEVAGKIKKSHRGDAVQIDAIAAEIGDVLWYCAGLATVLKLDLQEIAEENLAKLKNRQKDGKLQGDGDTR